MDWVCVKTRLIVDVIKSLKIEPFIFAYVLSTSLSEITTLQLVQDKICLNKYNQTQDYCIGVSTLKTAGSGRTATNNTKSEILADLAQFTIYSNIIGSLPSFFYVLFIGSWTDNYINGRKIALLFGILGYVGQYSILLLNAIQFDFDVYYILLAYIPSALSGGWSCIWLSSYSYMAHNSSEKYRLVKFAAFEIAVSAAGPLGTYLGGKLLGSGYSRSSGAIHYYEKVLTTSLIASIIGFFWILIVINEKIPQNDENSNLIINIEEEIQENSSNDNNESSHTKQQTNIKIIETRFKFSKMFDIQNLKDVFKTALKLRPNKGRAQIWLLYLSMCIYILANSKDFAILFPFVEEVYDWDAKEFSEIKSMASIVQISCTLVLVLTLSAYLNVGDTKLGIIGCVSILFSDLCIGSVIYPIGLYLMYVLGSASSISSMSIRSMLSKLATETEKGKIFSLLAALETVVPPLNVLFYNTLFEFTIDFYPSLCFQIAGALMFIPIFVYIWIDLTRIQY